MAYTFFSTILSERHSFHNVWIRLNPPGAFLF